jgi:hypothetical protein
MGARQACDATTISSPSAMHADAFVRSDMTLGQTA